MKPPEDIDTDEEQTLKVVLPGELYRQLHAERLLTGTYIRDIVEEALRDYYDELGDA